MRVISLSTLSALCVTLFLSPLSAREGRAESIILMNDDAESYGAGEPLPLTAASSASSYRYDQEAGEVSVIADEMAELLGVHNKVIRIRKAASKSGTYLDAVPPKPSVLTLNELRSADLKQVIEFDLRINPANTNQFYAAIRTSVESENLVVLTFKAPIREEVAIGYSTLGQEAPDPKKAIQAGTWYRVWLELHPADGEDWQATIQLKNKETGEMVPVAGNVSLKLQDQGIPSIKRLRFYQFSSPRGDNASTIDNVLIRYMAKNANPADEDATPSSSSSPSLAAQKGPEAPVVSPTPPSFTILGQQVITDERSGYVGWPTLAMEGDGTLLIIASGGRIGHACPFGKWVLYRSTDKGETWQGPEFLLDGKLDDRGCSLMVTGKGTLLAGGFSSIVWTYFFDPSIEVDGREKILDYAGGVTLEDLKNESGYWLMRSGDRGKTWEKYRSPVDSPHGPCQLNDGSLLYVGYESASAANLISGRVGSGGLIAARSKDDGLTWEVLSRIPVKKGHRSYQYHEPHAIQADDGTIIAHIRKSYPKTSLTLQTTSSDGGKTWTEPVEVYWGYPSHITRLKDGALLATYGYRRAPLGVRARISRDHGKTWGEEMALYNDAKSGDMGYPTTLQLADGSLITVWYEKRSTTETILQSMHWALSTPAGSTSTASIPTPSTNP